jgi:multicomponent Na+:H+ antiporter subunit G
MDVVDVIARVLVVFGCSLILLAGIGIVRFHHVLARMHAAAKAPTLGILSIALGVVLSVRTAAAAFTLLLVVMLQLVTAPVGSHLLGRAIYRKVEGSVDTVDELARDEGRPQP